MLTTGRTVDYRSEKMSARVWLLGVLAGWLYGSMAAITPGYTWLPAKCGREPQVPPYLQESWPGRLRLQNSSSQWPWLAMIGRQNGSDVDWYCGGALIGPQHVLTSATCLKVRSAHQLSVWAGAMQSGPRAESGHQVRSVAQVSVHPQRQKRYRDVAVLKLSSPLQASPSVQYTCLPSEGGHQAGGELLLPHWGLVRSTIHHLNSPQPSPPSYSYPAVLGSAKQIRIWPEQCGGYYSSLQHEAAPQHITDTVLCTYTDGSKFKNLCTGTRAGPLFRQENGVYTVQGVMSIGQACTAQEDPNLFSSIVDPKTLRWVRTVQQSY